MIITSILDTDVYKLHMQQAVWKLYPRVKVKLEFNCRNNEDLLPYIDDIKAEVISMAQLKLADDELFYLASLPFYQEDYLQFLKAYRFDPSQVHIFSDNNVLNISIDGLWHEVILWEVPLLEIISEVRNRKQYPHIQGKDAEAKLLAKIDYIRANQACPFNLIEFGSRRRFSKTIQKHILTILAKELPHQLTGTSNYLFAKELNLLPIGTQAHEWFQGHQRLVPRIIDSQKSALLAWLTVYPNMLGIALTDCITMDAFLRDFDHSMATKYTGLRQDSGDPILWGQKAINHYLQLGINPLDKMLVFSDGLTIPKAMEIAQYFNGKINTSFGIGTNLTCDIDDVIPMNIVIKMIECNGLPVAKISDTKGKMMCRDPNYIAELTRVFNLSCE